MGSARGLINYFTPKGARQSVCMEAMKGKLSDLVTSSIHAIVSTSSIGC